MSISAKDVKKLWGLAAGRCSRPGCAEVCIKFLADDPTVIGEMAHVIAKSPAGPRGVVAGGEDNLAVKAAPSGRWTLRDKVQRPLPTTLGFNVILMKEVIHL